MESSKISMRNDGVCGVPDSEMKKMANETNVFLPPVQLDNYEDFRGLLNEAALVVYSPEYFHGPFLDGPKQMRRLTLSAVGVVRNGLPLTFRFVLENISDLDKKASDIIEELESSVNAVRGIIEVSRPMGELLSVRS